MNFSDAVRGVTSARSVATVLDMNRDDDRRAATNDPESEACFGDLRDRIAWELGARIAAGDDPRTPEGLAVLSELIADAVLDAFAVRPRTEPRYALGERR